MPGAGVPEQASVCTSLTSIPSLCFSLFHVCWYCSCFLSSRHGSFNSDSPNKVRKTFNLYHSKLLITWRTHFRSSNNNRIKTKKMMCSHTANIQPIFKINSKMNQHDKWFLTEKWGSKYTILCLSRLEFFIQIPSKPSCFKIV